MEREDAFLVCLQFRDVPPHPYWVAGRPVDIPEIKAGQFTLLNLNYEHASYLSNPLDCLAAYVSRTALDSIANEQCAPRIEEFRIPSATPLHDIIVRNLGTCLLTALQRSEHANRLFLESVGVALLTHMACRYGGMPVEPGAVRGGLAPWQERRSKEMIAANIDGNISLEHLARACGLSRSHFARAFKRTNGHSPHRWLLAQRTALAEHMLLNSKYSLAEIATRCGFADQSHFSRVFTGIKGLAPGEWRRRRKA
jgi:AraC-like DNA-binding protein